MREELKPIPLHIAYMNWKGVIRERIIVPIKMWYGKTDWHPVPQYLLEALDVEDGKVKDFAMAGFDHWPWIKEVKT
jgi:predicted DNA-binding transcriptional regulator YafY